MDSLYLRNWRRVESTIKQWATEDEENSMELESTHDDEDISNIDTASGSDDEGCDREAVWLESENETEATSESDLGSDLADWALANKLTHKSVNELLQILQRHGHEDLPRDSRTLLSTPKVVSLQERCNGRYIYYGLERGTQRALQQSPACIDRISLCINVDGVPIFKSSGTQFWPILAKAEESEPFIVALYSGTSKPEPLQEYLKDLVEDINNLSTSGFQYNGAIVKITVKAFICDAPARAFLKNIIYHTGYNSCERCEELGEWKGRVVFNSKEKFPSRTDEKFCQVAYKGHQHGETPLLRAGVPCVTSFVLDYMHLVCLGVVRRILHFLYRVTNPRKLSTRQRSELSTRLVGLRN